MAEEDKKDGAVPPRLDLRKSAVAKPAIAPVAPAPGRPAVHAPAAPQAVSPVAVNPAVVPVNKAPAGVNPVLQSVVSRPVSVAPAPQVNKAPSNILKLASSSAMARPLGSSGGPMTLKTSASIVKPLQPAGQGQVQAPVGPAAAEVPEEAAPVQVSAQAPSVAPVVTAPGAVEPVQPAVTAGGLSPASGISPLKPSAAPVSPLRPAGAKPTLKIGASPLAEAKTVRLKQGVPGAKPNVPGSVGTIPEAKKETSKIPLDAARPAAETVSLKAPTGSIELKPNEADGKRKTSRISLESVLAADDVQSSGAGPSSGPKTIKLKRPSEAVTIKAVKKGPVIARPAEPVAADLSKTAALDEVEDGAAASGKRTVKVRRPSMKIKAGGGAVDGAGAAAGKAPEPVVYADTAHWVFWLFSLAAVLVVSVMTYMFTSQVIGPDYSLTRASYYTQGYNLDWPYKLSRMP